MPIYEYQCQICGHELESLQRIGDAPLSDCPECGKPALRKQVSAVAFRLKGGGWYETDFKSKNKRNVVDSGDSKPAEKSSDSGKKPEKKAACGSGGCGCN
jgi:putative FmdB family regulatory protein